MLAGIRPSARPPLVVAARGAGRRGIVGRPGRPRPTARRRCAARPRPTSSIVGGGYTGLWTALRLRELAPAARVVLLEADICGGGPSGRNGGFVTSWWDELPTLIERYGETGALAAARAMDGAVDEIGRWCAAQRRRRLVHEGRRASRSAPRRPRTGSGSTAVEALPAARGRRPVRGADGGRGGRRASRSPVMRAGAFMPGAATVQPARLARGLRRVALERGRRHPRGDAGRPSSTASGPAGSAASGPPGRRAPARPRRRRRSPGPHPDDVGRRATARSSPGSAVVAMNAWAAAWPSFGRRLVTWSSYIVLTEPIPDRLAELGWTGGEGVADARFTLHYLRTTPRRPDRHRRRRRSGRVRRSHRRGLHRRRAVGRAGGRRAAPAVPVAARRPDRGRLGRPDRHLRRPPAERSRACRAGRSTTPTATRATASGRRSWPARLLAGLAVADSATAAGADDPLAPRRAGRAAACGHSRRSRSATPAPGSSARPSCVARRPRSAASASRPSCASSPGCRAGSGYHLSPGLTGGDPWSEGPGGDRSSGVQWAIPPRIACPLVPVQESP